MTVYSGDENDLKEKLGEKLGEKLSKTQSSIIAAMHKNNKISQKELAKLLGFSDTTIENNTKYLQKKGFINRLGPAKGGYWVISTE